MKVSYLILFPLLIILNSCSNNNATVINVPVDTTITPVNAITDLFVDSVELENFINDQQLTEQEAALINNFYKSRNYQYAWFTSSGVAQQAYAFWNLHNHFISYTRDSLLHNDMLHKTMENLMSLDSNTLPPKQLINNTELQLTEHFFRFAHYAFNGTVDPEEFKWYIPRKKIDAVTLLDSLVANNGKNIDEWIPVNKMYSLIKEKLVYYHELQKNNTLPGIDSIEKSLRVGDTASIIPDIKKYLMAVGDMAAKDSSAVFDNELETAVKQFQKRFGLTQDGIIGKNFIRQMNTGVEKRIEQLLINMERMRWLPPRPAGNYIVANIPSFRLFIMENNKRGFETDIVVGKEGSNTVIFTDSLQYVVFSPYWNVPTSIVKNEIAPALNRNPGYITRNNMEITGYSNGLPIVRQKPGGNNALGLVKFIFPNNYNIYFHDTPTKYLFEREKRAFSHGCIRVKDAEKMANYILRYQPQWNAENINSAMHAGEEKWVGLKTPLPVFITYFTAWVDENDLLHFRDDIYGHDKKMAEHLFPNK